MAAVPSAQSASSATPAQIGSQPLRASVTRATTEGMAKVTRAGRNPATTAIGGASHSAYAVSAPNTRRNGRRTAITATMASAITRLARRTASRSSVIALLQVGDQLLDALDLLLGERAVLGVVGHQRRELAAEQPVQQALALAGQVLLAADQRIVADPAVLADGLDGLLLEQPVGQRLDRRPAPALGRPHLAHQFVGGQRTLGPQRLHDLALGGRDTGSHN